MRDPDQCGLPSVYPASESPSSSRVGAVVHISVPAEKAFPAEGLHIYGYPVSWLDFMYITADFLDYPDHFMSYSNTRNCTGNTAVLDVYVTCADASESYPYYGIPGV